MVLSGAFKDSDVATLLNSVRSAMPKDLAADIPVADSGQKNPFRPIGNYLQDEIAAGHVKVYNEWIETLINRIGAVVIDSAEIYNILAPLKKGVVPNGGSVQEIAYDIASTHNFSASKAEIELFKREHAPVFSTLHAHKRDVHSKQTLQDGEENQAFTNFESFDKHVLARVQSLPNGNAVEEYTEMKNTAQQMIASGFMTSAILKENSVSEIARVLTWVIGKMVLPTALFNKAYGLGRKGITTVTKKSKITTVISLDAYTALKIDFFAQLFNMSEAQIKSKIMIVDEFDKLFVYPAGYVFTAEDVNGGFVDKDRVEIGQTITEPMVAKVGAPGAQEVVMYDSQGRSISMDNLLMIVGDEDVWQTYDEIVANLSTVANPYGRYVNVILNAKTIVSMSPYVNSFAMFYNPYVATGDFEKVSDLFDGLAQPNPKVLLAPGTLSAITTAKGAADATLTIPATLAATDDSSVAVTAVIKNFANQTVANGSLKAGSYTVVYNASGYPTAFQPAVVNDPVATGASATVPTTGA